MKINYKLIGEGKETVLFLHGWGANLNSFLFCENALKNNYKLLLVDFPGFGESEKLNNVFSVFDYALEIFKLLTKLEINNVNIVCHSFGGRVAMLLSTIFNLKVNKLVLIDAAGIKPRFNLKTKLKIFNYKLKKFLKMDFYISFAGPITFKNSKNAEEIIEMVQIDKILIETDSPYLSPEPLRGKRNDPRNVKYIAQKIAEVKNMSVEEIAEITNKNARTIYNIKV